MYLLKNAGVNLLRSKGRTFLIGMILFIISCSTCLGLSIRQAAEHARENALNNLTITGQITLDRSSLMENMNNSKEDSSFDKSSFHDQMTSLGSLTIDELETYAKAQSVRSFYYTNSISVDGTNDLEPVSNTDSFASTNEDFNPSNAPQGGGRFRDSMGTQGDFTIIGYSTDEAMDSFLDGTCTLTEGNMFEEGTSSLDCIISNELATYNSLAVGDSIQIANPNRSEETYSLTIVGIYKNTQSTVNQQGIMGGFATGTDHSNQIYMSAAAVSNMIEDSNKQATVSVDETTGIESTTALSSQLNGTYTFDSLASYEAFSEEVYEMGLDERYTVTSPDIQQFEQSLLPLENLSQMALYFLLLILFIGAVILIVLNIFSTRERKYEIGVLTAIGMKKWKVALQFLYETLIITLVSVMLGATIGGATALPVTNSLLSSSIESQSEQMQEHSQAFGREMQGSETPDQKSQPKNPMTQYVDSVSQAMDVTVFLQLLALGFFLTILSSAASMFFIMRYDPLKILTSRD